MVRLAAMLGMLACSSAVAQTPDSLPQQPRDTLRRAGIDSIGPDSASVDSLRGTERFLRLQDRIKVRVPVAPRLGAEGPRPDGSRQVFSRDSLAWTNGESVADLVGQVEGAYVWRGGWLGRAAYGNFRGRGAASVDYLLDGVAYSPGGEDSVAVDAGRLPLSLFDRVEIERLPGLLRVHLFTSRHDRLASSSRIQIGTGTGGLTRFGAAIEQRTRGGFGASFTADYLNTTSASANANAYRNTHLLGVLQYVPTPRAGVEVVLLRNRPVRRPFANASTTADSGLADRRSDTRARFFLRSRDDGQGLGLDVVASRTRIADTLADTLAVPQLAQRIDAAGLILGARGAQGFVTAEGWIRSRWTTAEARVRSGLVLGGAVSLSADGVFQRHGGGRESRWAAGRASFRTPLGIVLGGSGRVGRLVAAPSVSTDTAQQITEVEVHAALETPALGLRGSVTRTSAFAPSTYAVFPGVRTIGGVGAITWATGGGRLRPLSWLTLESWGSTPISGITVGQPPRHAISTGTIRTKFLRTFPSGVVDLRLQLGVEYRDAFTLGFDGAGAPVTLPTATHLFAQAELHLQSFSVYFQQRNTSNRLIEYVPGFPIPGYANSFGIRWNFIN